MSINKVLGIILLIAALGVGGYYLYQNSVSQAPEAMMGYEEKRGDGAAMEKDGGDVREDTKGGMMEENDSKALAEQKDSGMMGKDSGTIEASARPQTVTVKITDSGFVPKEVSIKKGDSVMFLSESSASVWPASAAHPTHTVYPGSNIASCGTAQALAIFDACKGLSAGESWTFQFNSTGSWGYHDHLNASQFGKVNVADE